MCLHACASCVEPPHLAVALRHTLALQVVHEQGQDVVAVLLVAQGVEHDQPRGVQVTHPRVLQQTTHHLRTHTRGRAEKNVKSGTTSLYYSCEWCYKAIQVE